MHTENFNDQQGQLHSVQSFADSQPGLTKGGIRWIIFQHKQDLLKVGAIVYSGSKLIIVGNKFLRYIKEGRLAA